MFKKVCNVCNIEKDIDCFYNEKKRKDGKDSICKECVKIRSRRYVERNIEKTKEYKRSWYLQNYDRLKGKAKTLEFKEKKKVSDKKYREKNLEKIKNHCKEYREKNKDIISKKKKDYYYKTREHSLLKSKDWAVSNREKVRKSSSEYRKRNLFKKEVHSIFNNAVSKGIIVRPSVCSCCNKECVPDGHHTDYSKPFDVVWLCSRCHRQLHVND